MEILIGILCIPAGLLALCLIIAFFAAFEWLIEHGLLHIMFCAGLGACFGAVAQQYYNPESRIIVIVSLIVGAVIGLLLYVHFSLEYIKENAKDDKDNTKDASNENFCYCNRKCCKKDGRG